MTRPLLLLALLSLPLAGFASASPAPRPVPPPVLPPGSSSGDDKWYWLRATTLRRSSPATARSVAPACRPRWPTCVSRVLPHSSRATWNWPARCWRVDPDRMTPATSRSVEPSHARLNAWRMRIATAAEHGSALQRLGRWNAATHGVALLLVAHVAHAADRLQLDPAGLSPAQQQVATQTLADVQALLPDGLLRALPAQVQVRWRDDLPADVHGRAFAGRIALRRELLDDAVPGAPRTPQRAGTRTDPCRRPYGANWSRVRWRDLAGWQRKPWHLGRGDNDFRDRSPDAYELKDPAEYLAVNAEHFVLDSEFACRRPALAQWFQVHFGTPPSLPQSHCANALPLLQAESEEGRHRCCSSTRRVSTPWTTCSPRAVRSR